MMIRNIVWDWNGTLLDDLWLCLESINNLLANRNIQTIDHTHYRRIFGFPVREYYERAGFKFAQEPFEVPAKQFIDLYNKKKKDCSLQEGAKTVLTQLSRHHRQFILSASESAVLIEMLQHHDLLSFFESIKGLDNHYADGKSELAKQLAADFGLNPDETVLIGDTCHDYEVASLLGWKAVLFSGGHYARSRLEGANSLIIDQLSELPGLLHPQQA